MVNLSSGWRRGAPVKNERPTPAQGQRRLTSEQATLAVDRGEDGCGVGDQPGAFDHSGAERGERPEEAGGG
jgi:hypothetical protein